MSMSAIDVLLQATKKKIQDTASRMFNFVQQNPTPISYVQNKISPPTVSPLPQPSRLQQMQPQINNVARSAYSAVNPIFGINDLFNHKVPQAQSVLQSIGKNQPKVANVLGKLEQPVQGVKNAMLNPYDIPAIKMEFGQGVSPLSKIAAKTAEGAYNNFGRPILNAPGQFVKGVTATGLDIGAIGRGDKVGFQKVAGDVGTLAKSILDLGMIPTGGKVAAEAAATAMQQGLWETIGKGALSGGKFGFVYGLAQGTIDNKDIKNILEYTKNIGIQAGTNALGGAALTLIPDNGRKNKFQKDNFQFDCTDWCLEE